MRLAILTPADIAKNRFMPALFESGAFEYAGVGKHSEARAAAFAEKYTGKVYDSYDAVIEDESVDAIYIPLPPSMHYEWAKKALNAGKHVFLEKPFTISYNETAELVALAKANGLAIHENYMFPYHSVVRETAELVAAGTVGKVRLYRLSFGFPRRAAGDFRYDYKLGGGAFLDAGGYCLRYGTMLLGEDAKVACAVMNPEDTPEQNDGKSYGEKELDLFGSGTMVGNDGTTLQFAFGMDQNYACELEVWGSTGKLTVKRILTAPAGFEPSAFIERNGQVEERKLSGDDSFKNSILRFKACIDDESIREDNYGLIMHEAELSREFIGLANN